MKVSGSRPYDLGVVIPHKEQEQFLPSALESIVTQMGGTRIHTHIQDGGQSRDVLEIVSSFTPRFESRGFKLSLKSEIDEGPADAINRGFKELDSEIGTWLGADDFFLPGAVESVQSFRRKYPGVKWLTGAPFAVTSEGVPISGFGPVSFSSALYGFPRILLKRGLMSTAINYGTIQQEGTFWSLDLWRRVDGLNPQLRLAFDYDLWMRMAQFEDLVQMVAPLAAFRKHPNQASANQEKYAAEVQNLLETNRSTRPPFFRVSKERALVAFVGSNTREWHMVSRNYLLWEAGTQSLKWTTYSLNFLALGLLRRVMVSARFLPPLRFLYYKLAKIRKNATALGSESRMFKS